MRDLVFKRHFLLRKKICLQREEIKMRYHLGNNHILKGSQRNSLLGLLWWRSQPAFSQPAAVLKYLAAKFKEQDVVLLQTCSSVWQTDRRMTGLATSASHKRLALFLANWLLLSLGNWAFEEASLTPFDSDDRQTAHFLTSKPLAWCSKCSHPLHDTLMLCFIKLGF